MKKYIACFCFILLVLNALAQSTMRSVQELTSDTSAWPLLLKDIAEAKNKIEILPVISGQNKEAIYQTQVTAHSYMGAVIYFTGGILVNNGWIRILGSGNPRLNRSLPGWNKGKSIKTPSETPTFLLIADDADGGFFAINGGRFGKDMGQIYYLAPERLIWEALHITYYQFLNFCFVGDMDQFYDGLRWKGWQTDTAKLTCDQVFNFYPYLWTTEGKNITIDSKTIVPVQELYDFKIGLIK